MPLSSMFLRENFLSLQKNLKCLTKDIYLDKAVFRLLLSQYWDLLKCHCITIYCVHAHTWRFFLLFTFHQVIQQTHAKFHCILTKTRRRHYKVFFSSPLVNVWMAAKNTYVYTIFLHACIHKCTEIAVLNKFLQIIIIIIIKTYVYTPAPKSIHVTWNYARNGLKVCFCKLTLCFELYCMLACMHVYQHIYWMAKLSGCQKILMATFSGGASRCGHYVALRNDEEAMEKNDNRFFFVFLCLGDLQSLF